MQQAQGAVALQVAFIAVADGLFEALAAGPLDTAGLAAKLGLDAGYLTRWADAAYAFEYLDEGDGGWALTAKARAFLKDAPGTLMPFAVMANLTAHMAERAAVHARTGHRPGEAVLEEREAIVPLFGPMMEASFAQLFAEQILPHVPVYAEIDARGGLAVDLGCGNGWYLHRLLRRCGHLRGVGMDQSSEAIAQATARAQADGLADRLSFRHGDLFDFQVAEPVDLIAMNRALHHVWGEDVDRRRAVFRILADHLAPGGAAVIWEPVWPKDRAVLRQPPQRGLAFQNLAEHLQGNRFLHPDEIAAELAIAGLEPEVFTFLEGREAVVVGRRPG
ncbi:MAG: methyltransferase domain-containing protein [Myxococcales bacterium]|nr:methyltransferase domain-containing protein [Myxococcales bacterium]